MKELLLQALIIAYASVGVIGFIAYWPTIKDLYRHKKASANVTSYILWTATSGIGFLYSLFILPDLLFRIVSGLSFGACALVLTLSINLKYDKWESLKLYSGGVSFKSFIREEYHHSTEWWFAGKPLIN